MELTHPSWLLVSRSYSDCPAGCVMLQPTGPLVLMPCSGLVRWLNNMFSLRNMLKHEVNSCISSIMFLNWS